MPIKIVENLKTAERKYEENSSPANKEELEGYRAMLYESKIRTLTNQLIKEVSNKTREEVKVGIFGEALTYAQRPVVLWLTCYPASFRPYFLLFLLYSPPSVYKTRNR